MINIQGDHKLVPNQPQHVFCHSMVVEEAGNNQTYRVHNEDVPFSGPFNLL